VPTLSVCNVNVSDRLGYNINLFKNHLDKFWSSCEFVYSYSLCVCNLFIRAGNRGRWPASMKLVTLPYIGYLLGKYIIS